MKLLIVDDIPSVADGLHKHIAWDELGFTEVFPAYNALEARAILAKEAIDVMLSDIQMPVENGLELFAWTREQGLHVYTIFLTSFADFQYAQQAVKLGGFDYIVQPAPYEEIYEAVKRAVVEIEKERKIQETTVLGQVFVRQEDTLASNCFRNLLEGSPDWEDFKVLEKLSLLPKRNENIFLVLLHILGWEKGEKLEPSLFQMAILNVIREIFEPQSIVPVLCQTAPDIYAIGIPAQELNEDDVKRQIYFFTSVCRQYFECNVAAFISNPVGLSNSPETWTRLIARQHENITHTSGVYQLERYIHNEYIYRVPEITQWAAFLKDKHAKAMEDSAVALLDKMVESGKMNTKTLMVFQLDFMEMLHTITDDSDKFVSSILNTPEKMEVYRKSASSINAMKQFIHMVASCVEQEEDCFDVKTMVGRITRYINENLDSELKKESLAEYVNLSPDYLTRIFKKEMGVTIKEYIISQRMQTAKRLLCSTNLPVSFIAAKVGYCNFSHFSYTYKKEMGVTPLDERKGVEQSEEM